MEPTTDAQPLPAVIALSDDDLLHRVEAAPRLHLEEHELVPRRGDAPSRDGLRLQNAIGALPDGVELERAAPLPLPELVVRERHVEDVRDASRADDVVVVEQVAALAVRVDRHVPFHAREGAAAGDGTQKVSKLGGVERVAELFEVREERELLFAEVRKRCKVACLVDLHARTKNNNNKRQEDRSILNNKRGRGSWEMCVEGFVYLVYVGLFFGKVEFAKALILDLLEEILAEQFFDEGMFERLARRVRGGQSADVVRIEQIGRET